MSSDKSCSLTNPKYCCIGKCVTDFLDKKTYKLNRTANICVISEKVRWCLENVLNSKGQIESELSVSHDFNKDSLSLKTSTIAAPKFGFKTNRFEKYGNFKVEVQEPSINFDFCFNKYKAVAVCAKAGYDWQGHNCDGEIAICYSGLDRVLLGAKINMDRQQNNAFKVSDYNIGIQFCQNEDRTIALTSENSLSKFNIGSDFKVKDGYRGYAQVSYDTKAQQNSVSFGVGATRKINENSKISGVYYYDNTASFLYCNNFEKSNISAKLGVNFDFNKNPADRASIEWKIVFGECQNACAAKQKQCCNKQ